MSRPAGETLPSRRHGDSLTGARTGGQFTSPA
jgi:hypothetical protein